MIDLGDRRILDDGTVLCRAEALIEMLYAGKDISTAMAEPCDDIDLHDRADRLLDSGYGAIDTSSGEVYAGVDWFSHWMTPAPYDEIDVEELCLGRCKDDRERDRIQQEMALFRDRRMVPVLRHLVFLVDHWRERGIFWGVGRGSSVSSLVLHLIGINRINPLDFDLDIGEFIK